MPVKEIKEAYVGFRVYSEEEGHKWDDDGRKYIGWSNKYDEWVTVTSPTIQKFQTLIKHYNVAGKSTMIYDHVIEDIQDIIYNTKDRKVWAVFRMNFFSNLKCIPDYFNEFGFRGGFDAIIEFMLSITEGRKVTMRHLHFLIEFLNKTMPLWHR